MHLFEPVAYFVIIRILVTLYPDLIMRRRKKSYNFLGERGLDLKMCKKIRMADDCCRSRNALLLEIVLYYMGLLF